VLTPEENWDLTFLQDNLPNNIVNQVLTLPAPDDADGPDTIGWGELILTSLLFKVLIGCNMGISML